jgi:hypothetical protein
MPQFSIGKLALIAIAYGALMSSPSYAMNWEGHDDWMADLPPAIEFQANAADANLPLRPSDACGSFTPRNPYEQIPLATDTCSPRLPTTGKVRRDAKP